MDDSGLAGAWGERTSADLSSLLLELGRAWKAASFYGPDDPTTEKLIERACRAWQSDLARAGPVELELTPGGFRLAGVRGVYGDEHLGQVSDGLARLGIQRLRFTEVLSSRSLTAFVRSLLEIDAGNRPASQLGIEVDGEICVSLDSDGDAALDAHELQAGPPLASLGSSLLRSRRREPGPTVEPEKPEPGDEGPAAPPDAGSARLVAILQDLDRCSDDERYERLAGRAVDCARALCDEGLIAETLVALFTFADHVMGEGGRSAVQARIARSALLDLAIGDRLAALIDRACSNDTTGSVRAAQVLLIVGEQAVPALLERLDAEAGGAREGQLTGLLIALGECAVPALRAAMGSGSGNRARLGVKIAGDIQCPELVKPLRDLLCAKDGSLQKDAARALVEMGNSAALRALLEAVESRHDRTAEVAAYALGSLRDPRGLTALVRRLERATQERGWSLARQLLQAIGQFERGDRATARALLAWVQRGGPPWRRPDLDLKLEAISTLGQLAGDETTAALREIAGLRAPSRLCERARRILDRRGDGRRAPR